MLTTFENIMIHLLSQINVVSLTPVCLKSAYSHVMKRWFCDLPNIYIPYFCEFSEQNGLHRLASCIRKVAAPYHLKN